ncbi:MAG: hypothetical protein ABL932_17375, partial [Terricaulis sp.]
MNLAIVGPTRALRGAADTNNSMVEGSCARTGTSLQSEHATAIRDGEGAALWLWLGGLVAYHDEARLDRCVTAIGDCE